MRLRDTIKRSVVAVASATYPIVDWAVGRMLAATLRWRDFVGKVPAVPLDHRRTALVGAVATLGLMASGSPARADQNFTSFAFLDSAPSSITSRTDPDRWGDIINVKSYGALGDGTAAKLDTRYGSLAAAQAVYPFVTNIATQTIDWAAFQAAFNAAFGPASSPHGNGGGKNNRVLWVPNGDYKISNTIVGTAIWGGRILGAGNLCSIITFTGAVVAANSDNICPDIWFNGCNFTTVEGLSLAGPAASGGINTACIWFGPDGAAGGTSSHGNFITMVNTIGTTVGFHHGSSASQANSENTYLHCNCDQHAGYGIFLSGQNTLNINCYGCSFDLCLIAGIGMGNGAIASVIVGFVGSRNGFDIIADTTEPLTIIGGRSESQSFLQMGSTYVNIIGFNHNGGSPPGNGKFIDFLGGSGVAVCDNCRSFQGEFYATNVNNNNILYIRGGLFARSDYLDNYLNTIAEIPVNEIYRANQKLVANLPPAATNLVGIRTFVWDANSTTFGATAVGGGSNKMPVVCNGTVWVLG